MAIKLRLLPRLLAFMLAASAYPVVADPFTIDRLLRDESFGSVRISPDEQNVLFERLGPYETSDRFDLGYFSRWTTSEVWVADRSDPTHARPLLAASEARGVVLGEFSPSGRRILVHRLQNDRWESGVVEVATGGVRWLGLGAEPPVKGETVLWRSDDEVILIARADGDLPYEIGGVARAARQSRDRREASARGEASATVWGAGAFADSRSNAAELQMWRIDLGSGDRTLLAAGQMLDLALSPDGRWLAVVDRGAPYSVDPNAPLRPSDPAERRRLRVLSLETGQAWLPCGECDIAGGLLAFSGSQRLLVWEREAAGRPVAGRLLAISPVTRQVAVMDMGEIEPDVGQTRDTGFQFVRAGWLGDDAILLGRRQDEVRTDWYRVGRGATNLTRALSASPGNLEALGPSGFLTFADGSLWSVDGRGRASRVEGPDGLSAVTTLTNWASPRRRLNMPPSRPWAAGRTADGSLWRLQPGSPAQLIASGLSMALSATGESLVVDEVVENGVKTLRLAHRSGPPRPLSVINAAHAEVEFAKPLPVLTAEAPEGSRNSWLFVPPGGLKPKTPVIIVAYPGRSGRVPDPAEFFTMDNVQLLSGLGYAVLTPTLPGTGAEGPAALLTDRILATLDAALAQYPELDGERVGYLGHSFGGYTGLVLATQTRRIRSFVILSTTANLTSSWGSFAGFGRANPEVGFVTVRRNAGWSETGQGAIGGTPWSATDAFVANSPLFRAGEINDPVLLVHGELDFVPISEPESLFTALWRQNKDVQLVTYWGEQHLFYSPGTLRDFWRRIDLWFGRTVGLSPARLTLPPAGLPSDEPTPQGTPAQEAPPRHPAIAGHPR